MGKVKNNKTKNAQSLKVESPALEGVRADCGYPAKTIYRFLSYVKRNKSCWKWEGSFTRDGYAQFWLSENKVVKAHRFAYEVYRENIGEKTRLKNTCKDKQCVNPLHWEILTSKEKRE